MSAFKAFPKVRVEIREDGLARVIDQYDRDVLIVLEGDTATLDRFVECWNTLRKIAFPAAHMESTEEYVARLQTLRREAWKRVEELEAERGEA